MLDLNSQPARMHISLGWVLFCFLFLFLVVVVVVFCYNTISHVLWYFLYSGTVDVPTEGIKTFEGGLGSAE